MNKNIGIKFVKKPVVVEAVLWDGTEETAKELFEWSNHHTIWRGMSFITIETLEGSMIADKGDWIIKGIKGEFYPCKPDIFKATYELYNEF